MKSEVVMCEDDFTFDVNRNRPPIARFHFLKKKIETDMLEDGFTYNVVLHQINDFNKSNFTKILIGPTNPILQISVQIDPKIQKSRNIGTQFFLKK